MKWKEFWIDPIADEEMQDTLNAYSKYPEGPFDWHNNLIHVTEMGQLAEEMSLHRQTIVERDALKIEVERLRHGLAIILIESPKWTAEKGRKFVEDLLR